MTAEKVSLTGAPQQHPQDPSYVPPAEAIPLPSQGKLYPPDHPLHAKDRLEIRAMTARDEDILMSEGLIKQGKVVDMLLKSCIHDRSVDPDTMLAGDRNAALIAFRITGYGKDYKASASCSSCGRESTTTFDLSQLRIRQLGQEPIAPFSNRFLFKLPVSKVDVHFKLFTGADERELSTTLEQVKKTGQSNDGLVTTKLIHQIVSVGGVEEQAKIAAFVMRMPARDSRDLRKHVERITPDVDMKQSFACRFCREETEVTVPLGTEFFWPES